MDLEVRLYDANGLHLGSMAVDEEPAKDGLVESGGKTYMWNQRNNQWREVSGTFKGKTERAASAANAQEAPKGEVVATNVAGAGEKAH